MGFAIVCAETERRLVGQPQTANRKVQLTRTIKKQTRAIIKPQVLETTFPEVSRGRLASLHGVNGFRAVDANETTTGNSQLPMKRPRNTQKNYMGHVQNDFMGHAQQKTRIEKAFSAAVRGKCAACLR